MFQRLTKRNLSQNLELNFEVIKETDNSNCRNKNDIKLFNLGSIALFSDIKLTRSSGKHLDDISHAHIVYLMYKLLTSIRASYDPSIGFDRSRGRRRDKLTCNKSIKGKYHVKIMLKDVVGCAEHQEKATCGLSYSLTLTGNKNKGVSGKTAGVADARIKIDHIHWYVPHLTFSIQ